MEFSREDLLREVKFKTSRSGGKGGQNINKVSSKVELNLYIHTSTLFSDEQKQILLEKLANRINSGGVLQIITEEERSQYLNKIRSMEKLILILNKAFYKPKLRKITKPKRSSIEDRLRNKLLKAQKKINRKRDFLE